MPTARLEVGERYLARTMTLGSNTKTVEYDGTSICHSLGMYYYSLIMVMMKLTLQTTPDRFCNRAGPW
jgi:hypothetical protein